MPAIRRSPTRLVVEWADGNLRDLPWRRSRDPWAILVAEVMLQQTQVSRVVDRWSAFLDDFPDPATCASATSAELVRRWAGLGYNRRALMLHHAATRIVERHDGIVPDDLRSLMDLPGIGPYTARAVLAFAYERSVAPVDTNIGRVLARTEGRSLSPAEAQQRADRLVAPDAAWLYNQGVMELGATICTKRRPRCGECPLVAECAWRGSGADPAIGSAATSKPQATFVGSDRQMRGRLIDALRRGPVALGDVAAITEPSDPARCERITMALVADGLIAVDEGVARLAGDAAEVSPGR